jgi:serine/threonine protein kinase
MGKTIGGKYYVRSVLGEGGMGTVFEAEHLTLGRSVAVKVLHPKQARKKNAVRRFHQEARAAGAIGHPNICEVYDLGTLDDNSPYLVMERLVGETLADRIASEGGLPFDDTIDILIQVLSGLVAAHEKGIVHRDIKPENVFLTRRVGCPPVVKLLDFGVSKMIVQPLDGGRRDEETDLTRTGMVMGTPYYMAPEQARGDRNLDARVDLYACGVMFYEALTGRRPFTAANYQALLLQILSTTPRPARDLRPALPGGFDAVLDKAMARSRDDRYRTAADMQRDLQALRDRHLVAPASLGDAMRGAAAPIPNGPPSAHGFARESFSARSPQEPTPSSVEIPIVFSGDASPSGELDLLDDALMDDQPTRVGRAIRDGGADAHTTQKRGPEFASELARAHARVRDTDAMGRPAVRDTDATGRPAIRDTDATGRPAIRDTDGMGRPVPLRVPVGSPGDRRDGVPSSRLASPGSAVPRRRSSYRVRPTGPAPGSEDTAIDEAESGEPTLLMPARPPKVPHR